MKIAFTLLFLTAVFGHSFGQVKIDSLLIDGNYRSFRFQEPAGPSSDKNLIFILHGSGGDGQGMMKPAASLQAIAAREGAFLVYPDGYKRYWNECRKEATSETNIRDINEQAFFSAMHRYFAEKYGVNGARFFVIGLSGGGHMAYKLAMTMPGQCKAISAVVANVPDTTNLDCAEAKKPVAVLITNGTADNLNPHTGGKMIMSGASWGEVRSTERSFQYWAGVNGYQGKPSVQNLPDPNPSNQQNITRYTYRAAGKPEVTLLQVNGGGHAFPQDIDIFLESWAFFQREIQRQNN